MTDQTRLQPALLLTLSQDELTFLLRALGFGRLASFVPPADFDAASANAASRSLRAHGLATLTAEGQYVIEEAAAAMVAAAASFNQMLTVTHEADGQRADTWFYITPGLTIQHRQPEPEIHSFQSVPDGMSMLLLLAGALGMMPPRADVPDADAVIIAKPAFDAAQRAYADGAPQQAVAELVRSGAPEALANAVAYPLSRSVLSAITPQAEGAPEVAGMLVLETEAGYWGLQPEGDGLLAQPMKGQMVLDQIASMLTSTRT